MKAIPKNQMVQDAIKHTLPPKVVRHAGELNWVEVDGIRMDRKEFIDIPDIGRIKCAPTDNHFVYRLDPKIFHRPGWTLFCTCGSPSVIVNYDAYKELGSDEGAMLVCMSMVSTGRHQSGEM